MLSFVSNQDIFSSPWAAGLNGVDGSKREVMTRGRRFETALPCGTSRNRARCLDQELIALAADGSATVRIQET